MTTAVISLDPKMIKFYARSFEPNSLYSPECMKNKYSNWKMIFAKFEARAVNMMDPKNYP